MKHPDQASTDRTRFVYLTMLGNLRRTEEQDEEMHQLYDRVYGSQTAAMKPAIAAEFNLAVASYEAEFPDRKKMSAAEVAKVLGAEEVL